ncbi:MAG: hypothetical protein Q9221_000354 [Calogaya cf. arnoldii]
MDCLCKTHKYYLERQAGTILERYQKEIDPSSFCHAKGPGVTVGTNKFTTNNVGTSNVGTSRTLKATASEFTPRAQSAPQTPLLNKMSAKSNISESAGIGPSRRNFRSTTAYAPAPSPSRTLERPDFSYGNSLGIHPSNHRSIPEPPTTPRTPYRTLKKPEMRWAGDSPGIGPGNRTCFSTPRRTLERPDATPSLKSEKDKDDEEVEESIGIRSFRQFAKVSKAFWFEKGREQAIIDYGGSARNAGDGIGDDEKQLRQITMHMEHLYRIYDKAIDPELDF